MARKPSSAVHSSSFSARSPTELTPLPRELRFTGAELAFAGAEVRWDARTETAGRLLAQGLGADDGGAAGAASAGTGPSAARPAAAPAPPALVVDVECGAAGLPPEGYTLRVAQSRGRPTAVVRGADPAGAFYGAQTLLALLRQAPAGHDVPARGGLAVNEAPAGAGFPVSEAPGDGESAFGLVPDGEVRDWPQLGWRGTVEGFYGPPWSHEDRLEHLRFAGRHKLNHYVYAPKDDPFHRDRWREPYPPGHLARLAELVAAARAQHVRFVWAVSPGLTMRYADPAEHEQLRAKAAQLWEIGVRDFALLFDDIPLELTQAADRDAFGEGPGAAGAAHGHACAEFVRGFLAPRGVTDPLLMVPTDYAGTAPSPYREYLAATLPAEVLVWWTGADIVTREVTDEDVAAAAATYRHRLLLWDNFPVNDFDPTRLFLGPLTGRPAATAGTALSGISANPMVAAAPSQLPLATVAEYAWNPAGYDPAAAAARALHAVAGPDAAALAPLVQACTAWPPSALQSAHLRGLVEAAESPDRPRATAALHQLDDDLAALEAGPRSVVGAGALVRQLGPWLAAGADMARAGRLAARLRLAQLGGDDERRDALVPEVEAALRAAEEHYPDVLRGIVPPFVRAVLLGIRPAAAAGPAGGRGLPPDGTAQARAGGAPAEAGGSAMDARLGGNAAAAPAADGGAEAPGDDPAEALGNDPVSALGNDAAAAPAGDSDGADQPASGAPAPWALVVTADQPRAGEKHLADLLRGRGLVVRFGTTVEVGVDDPAPPSLLVVTHTASPAAAQAAAGAAVPMLACGHLVDLGLATTSGDLLGQDLLDVVAPEDPLAAGRSGHLAVYRGPATVAWGAPTAAATVVARTLPGAHPALFRYPAGAALADGSPAPAPRVAVFLGPAALAPGLLTEDGRAMVAAAVDEVTAHLPAPLAGAGAARPD
ncbi:beta-N-acetylglucosaminidase domain-containing protein [Georgenia sp. TF02-10]|uniref:beta-N-acetylhexosaminidase family protein n=1 Tax=Georgenia sp. TF02-10 TaxID=2917725 RepID=UPI001FA7316A|nr:beta-N-acetylglucosaminidase domain-containing protein [Georgenia sp. TF02-10]UNX56274.1 beta-N-acetylglucosaminidase domain-containing protein [Georgenia sp. TF02-10]